MAKKKKQIKARRTKKTASSVCKTGKMKSGVYYHNEWKRKKIPSWLREIITAQDQADTQKAKDLLVEEKLQRNLATLTDHEDIYFCRYEIALLLVRTFQAERALKYCFEALEIGESVLIYNVIGLIYEKLGKCDLVIQYLEKARQLEPDNISVYNNLGINYIKYGKFEEAIDLFRKAVAKNPQYKEAYSNLLLNLNYLPDLDFKEIFEESKRWASYQAPAHLACRNHDNVPDPHRKLRIGYVSSDIKVHSVMYFFESLLMGHDRTKYEIYGYGDVNSPDSKTPEFVEQFDGYRNIKEMKDEDAAELIKSDKIDILVDLSGHTARNRLSLFAYKSAPIQVTYLGYPNTTGMSQIDYRLTDAIADTSDQQQYYSEELVFLPNGFLCFNPGDIQPPIRELPCLNKDYLLFGCFNNPKKINSALAKTWVDLLTAVPNSKLLLKFKEGGNEMIKEYFWNLFAEQGLKDPQKRIMIFGSLPYKAHLDLYNSIDIALDTYPYNGTTTTCQALLMGVPVITLTGKHHASRVGLDILSRVGMEFFSAQTPEDYVKKAAALASKPEALAKIRSTMRHRLAASALCNYKLITNDIENEYRKMWHTWCQQQGVDVTDAKSKLDASQNIPIREYETDVEEDESESESYMKFESNLPEDAPVVGQNTVCCSELQSSKIAAAVKTRTRKLHIGGKVSHPEWELLNIQAGPDVDHIGDAQDLSQFEDETFDALYASHVVEHFDYKGPLQAALQEWHRVLKPGGQLYISVPDMDALCRLFLDGRQNNPQQCFHIMRMMFGGHVDPYDYHFVGLNFDLLSAFLKTAKFHHYKRVKAFGIFKDTSNLHYAGVPISLNVVASK